MSRGPCGLSPVEQAGQLAPAIGPPSRPRGRSHPGRNPSSGWLLEHRAQLLAAVAVAAIAAGGVLYLLGLGATARLVWGVAVALLAAELTLEVGRTIVVEHSLGVDTIALVAMVGALALGQELAGAVIGLMFSGGAALEAVASRRARRELTALVQRAPTVAQLRDGNRLREVSVARVQAGDVVLVRTGEVVPVDGTVLSAEAVVDTSTLSGEPLPETVTRGTPVLSGSANAGAPFDVRADRPAHESAYAALVRLVEQAQSQRAPLVRMADRYAGFFLPTTLAVAGLAWALSTDPVRGACRGGGGHAVPADPGRADRARLRPLPGRPSGGDRQGRRGDRGAGRGAHGPVRQDRHADRGRARGARDRHPQRLGEAEVLRLAASLDRLSAHVLGEALVRGGDRGRARADDPDRGQRGAGAGNPGHGRPPPRRGRQPRVHPLRRGGGGEIESTRLSVTRGSGEAHIVVAVDGHVAGVIVMADVIRPDAQGIVDRLRRESVRHVAMLSGDRRSVAERVGRQLGVDRVYAEQSPQDKLEVVRRVRAQSKLRPVIMVGDGVNDAPALALADVGIAMGAAGATVSSETADAVVTVDRIDRVADAVHIGRRAMRIARQSVLAGMGLSIAAMAVAAAGYLPPVAGALFQEVIDLAVILNALRALRG